MRADIIDNRHIRLADCVRSLIEEGATVARFAVGYLFVDGLAPLQPQIARLHEVYFLIGNVVNRLTEEQMREDAVARQAVSIDRVRDQEDIAVSLREAHRQAASVMALNLRQTLLGMPRTDENRALLITLARRIADGGLKVRLFTDGRIHAKAALLDFPSVSKHPRQIAVVGSSNLTLSAPAHPTEMNIVVRDVESTKALETWYLNLWDQSQDFHRELFEELGQCWALEPASAA